MIMKDTSKIRPTHILKRGVYDNLGDEVTFNTPKAILPFDTTRFEKNRLGLAKWLLDKNNPLTARVYVNRLWQEFFGRGLVKTSGDFGMQGDMPSHPQLLDWMAVDFMKNGWDIKRMVKKIVMSATYRQSAQESKEKIASDPENKYLTHAPRLKLPAELVRDLVLSSSGLLVNEIGGPSVKPYQPKGIWESTTSGRGQLARYVQDHDEKLYRRGMYTFIKRTAPPPVMLTFDGPNRDQCEVRRMRTNTPLQALALMNDPLVLEASRVLAERLMLEQTTAEEKIKKAFRLIVCRNIQKRELEILRSYFDEEKLDLEKAKSKAASIINIGEYRHEKVDDTVSLASLMQVVQTLYNMEESVTR
jgi:hypothetical protein